VSRDRFQKKTTATPNVAANNRSKLDDLPDTAITLAEYLSSVGPMAFDLLEDAQGTELIAGCEATKGRHKPRAYLESLSS
jgi:hypothetical protein